MRIKSEFSESGGAPRVRGEFNPPPLNFYLGGSGAEEVAVIIVGVIYGVACKSYMHYDITYLVPSLLPQPTGCVEGKTSGAGEIATPSHGYL